MAQLGTVLVTGGAGFIGCALSQDWPRRPTAGSCWTTCTRRCTRPPNARTPCTPPPSSSGATSPSPGTGPPCWPTAPRRRGAPGSRDRHRPVPDREQPSLAGQRRWDDPDARRLRGVRTTPGARRADEQPSRLRRGHVAAVRRDVVPPRSTDARAAGARALGLPRQRARAEQGRPDRAGAVERVRRHQAGPGAHPGGVGGAHDVRLSTLRLQNV